MKRLRAWLRRASGVFRQERRDAEFRNEHDERNCGGSDPAGTNRDAAARAFAALVLVLAGIGIYSVISYAVTRRTHEIGIRAALGASEQSITRMVVREGLVLAAIGVMSGLAGVLVIRRMLSRLPVEVRVPLLFDVRPHDPATLASVSGILVLVALGACYLLARGASRVDPMVALRHERLGYSNRRPGLSGVAALAGAGCDGGHARLD